MYNMQIVHYASIALNHPKSTAAEPSHSQQVDIYI